MDNTRARRQRLIVGILVCKEEFRRRGVQLPFYYEENFDEMSLGELNTLLFHLRVALYHS
jgi:hypothetical protein